MQLVAPVGKDDRQMHYAKDACFMTATLVTQHCRLQEYHYSRTCVHARGLSIVELGSASKPALLKTHQVGVRSIP